MIYGAMHLVVVPSVLAISANAADVLEYLVPSMLPCIRTRTTSVGVVMADPTPPAQPPARSFPPKLPSASGPMKKVLKFL